MSTDRSWSHYISWFAAFAVIAFFAGTSLPPIAGWIRSQTSLPGIPGWIRSTLPTQNISGSGCVEKVVENSCTVVIDSQTGELYNLLFPSRAPKPSTAIEFTGTPHKGATACTQGKPLNVSKWRKEKGIRCPPLAVIAGRGDK
jgi:hypothetical protein